MYSRESGNDGENVNAACMPMRTQIAARKCQNRDFRNLGIIRIGTVL